MTVQHRVIRHFDYYNEKQTMLIHYYCYLSKPGQHYYDNTDNTNVTQIKQITIV